MKLEVIKLKYNRNGNGKFRSELSQIRDYQTLYEFLQLNNIVIDTETLTEMCVDVVQNHLDSVARSKGYDSIISLCTYAFDDNSVFGNEGKLGVAWRSSVWSYCHQVLTDVQAETRSVPTPDELIAELPVINW